MKIVSPLFLFSRVNKHCTYVKLSIIKLENAFRLGRERESKDNNKPSVTWCLKNNNNKGYSYFTNTHLNAMILILNEK